MLVHGFISNHGAWKWFCKRLHDQCDLNCQTIDLEPINASIDHYADQLAADIDRLLQARGQQQVSLIGHSMGGLVIRAYLAAYGARKVAQVVTLGSPHQGTHFAKLMQGLNIAQMRPDSAWLRRLAKIEAQATLPPTTSIYSLHDNIISPQTSARLPYAKHVELAGIGHVRLLLSQQCVDIVASILICGGGWHEEDLAQQLP